MGNVVINGEDLQGMARGADWPLLSKTPRAKAASPGIIPGGWKEGEDPASVLDVAPLPLLVSQEIWGDGGISAGKRLEKITRSLGKPRADPPGCVWREQRTLHAQSKAEGFLLPGSQSDPVQELHFPTAGSHEPGLPGARGRKSHLCPAGNRMQGWWGPGGWGRLS